MVDGALDALDRIIGVVVRFGERVLVENPTFPPILDLLEQTGASPIGLAMDSSGIVPESLAVALRRTTRSRWCCNRARRTPPG